MPEYCGVISKKPTVKAELSRIEAEEENFDFAILDKVVAEARYLDIRRIGEETAAEGEEVVARSYYHRSISSFDCSNNDLQYLYGY